MIFDNMRNLISNRLHSKGIDSVDKERYKEISSDEVKEWGIKYYSHWMKDMQNQENQPKTPAEKFFRYYTQGIHHVYNRVLRGDVDLNEYCRDSIIQSEMIHDAINEMQKNPIPEDIIVYRFVEPKILKDMIGWSGVKRFKEGSIIFDKAFLSTTLTIDAVDSRHYANYRNILMKIYVPQGTCGVFLELIADMQENEMLFPPNTRLRVISKKLFNRHIECVIEN